MIRPTAAAGVPGCGALQRHSLIDYPGQVACVLFLAGCNFHCPYCHNPHLARGGPLPAAVSADRLREFLHRRQGFLDAVVISGGEPTGQPHLAQLCRSVREMGYRVKLDTNGSRPDVLRDLLEEGLVDYIAMDLKTDPARYAPLISDRDCLRELLESIEIILGAGIPHEFRTTCVHPLVDVGTLDAILRRIAGCHRFALQSVRTRNVLDPAFFLEARPCSPEEIDAFRALAAPRVGECCVR